jgi:hypothetical protein
LALLLGFRTLEQFGCARSQGNQAFQRSSEISLTLLMLIDAQRDLGLTLLQLTRLFVVFVLRNPPNPQLANPCVEVSCANSGKIVTPSSLKGYRKDSIRIGPVSGFTSGTNRAVRA